MHYRHGDLSFAPAQAIKGTKVGEKKFVLAVGEHTSHKHVITGDIEIFKDTGGKLYIKVGDSGVIRHEEHKPITLPKHSLWEMRHEQEHDYFLGEVVRVQD